MNKRIFKSVLVVLVLFVAVLILNGSGTARKETQEVKKLKQIKMTKEFESKNGSIKVGVEYEEEYGGGNARYIIKNREGELLGKFISDVAPYKIIVLSKINRLIVWGGILESVS